MALYDQLTDSKKATACGTVWDLEVPGYVKELQPENNILVTDEGGGLVKVGQTYPGFFVPINISQVVSNNEVLELFTAVSPPESNYRIFLWSNVSKKTFRFTLRGTFATTAVGTRSFSFFTPINPSPPVIQAASNPLDHDWELEVVVHHVDIVAPNINLKILTKLTVRDNNVPKIQGTWIEFEDQDLTVPLLDSYVVQTYATFTDTGGGVTTFTATNGTFELISMP